METLIIQVNCKSRQKDGPPQLGITVEAPYSMAMQQRQQQQQQDEDYRNHEYQNCHLPNGNINYNSSQNKHFSNSHQNGTTSITSTTSSSSSNTATSSLSSKSHAKNLVGTLGEQIQRGLQITQIQEGSVIDRNGQFRIGDIIVEVNGVNLQRRTFQEAQKTLREFVVKQSSHTPLQLKVLRKAASSSSLPSTTGSQSTVIERTTSTSNNLSPTSTTIPKKKSLSNNSTSTPSPQSSRNARHLIGALNTRRIGAKHRVRLTKSNDGGFGIKIAERDNMFGTNRPIYITAITTTGSAYRDGRLREGDMLLEINGIDLSGKSQPEVTKMLKGVGVNESVEFLVSRQEEPQNDDYNQDYVNTGITQISTENGCDNHTSLIDLDVPDQEDFVFTETTTNHQLEQKIDSILNVPNVDGPGKYIYDIPLNDTKSAGLGLYLKYPTLDRKDLGIWIEKVITGGAAWKDGRLLPDDQILAINGINLMDLSNTEASETLTAAVCRGVGPEATANTIRLNIQRRDPSFVAKILHGTNNRIEHSDLHTNGNNKSYSISDKLVNSTQDSYLTAFDGTIHSGSHSSNDTNSSSNKSSNHNSHNDSAMSPQTQASNSLKLLNSCNEKSDHNSSDRTNDTSSAISQITDFTSVPITNDTTPEKDAVTNFHQTAFTLPKTLELAEVIQNNDQASSIQSWEDESIDAAIGEERFQRDGFGRQSISEKRHAQLMAKNTDTFKRNQKLREDRERQRQLEEQLERQCLDETKRQSLNLNTTNRLKKMPNSITTNDLHSIYGRQVQAPYNNNFQRESHREVPVDVHLPLEPGIETFNGTTNETSNRYSHNELQSNNHNPDLDQQSRVRNQILEVNHCLRCGSVGPCACRARSIQRLQPYASNFITTEDQIMKRSNSLESIKHHDPIREGLIIPRAGTVRVARNRRVNESFRAAVDRSYESSMNDSARFDYSGSEQRRSCTRVGNSVANSTTSTSNDERFLISNTNGNISVNDANNNTTQPPSHKKSSSLLTRFLKFGSMKKNKKKNKDVQPNPKNAEIKAPRDTSSRDSETTRSQTSKSSHSRTQSIQSHNNSGIQKAQYQQNQPISQLKSDAMNNQMHGQHNMKQVSHSQQQFNNLDLHNHHTNRTSLHMYQYNQQPMHNMHINQNQQLHPNNLPQSKLAPSLMRPTNMLNNHQYSHMPLHHPGPPLPPLNQQQQQLLHQQIPIDIHNHQLQLQSQARHHMMAHNAHLGMPNGCQPPNHWQSPPVHTPTGLWVANSPVSEAQVHHHNIYGTHNQHLASLHNQTQQTSVNMSHPTPFIPPINTHQNGIMQQQAILQSHAPNMTQQHLHNHQPPHIYYYDF